MTRKLSEADRAAVDLMFDRINATRNGGRGNGANGNGGGNGGDASYIAMNAAVSEERLSAVQRIISTLEQMPAAEPSADLVVRTLQRVARAAQQAPVTTTQPAAPAAAAVPPFIDPTQPMA